MLARLSFWTGILLIAGSYLWGLWDALQRAPGVGLSPMAPLKAFTPTTLACCVIGAILIVLSLRRPRPEAGKAKKMGRFRQLLPYVMAIIFLVPAAQPIVWSDKSTSPFGPFAEHAMFIAIMIEILCVIVMARRVQRVRRERRDRAIL